MVAALEKLHGLKAHVLPASFHEALRQPSNKGILILLLQTGRLSLGVRKSAQGHRGTSCEAKAQVQAGLTLAQTFTMALRAQCSL